MHLPGDKCSLQGKNLSLPGENICLPGDKQNASANKQSTGGQNSLGEKNSFAVEKCIYQVIMQFTVP